MIKKRLLWKLRLGHVRCDKGSHFSAALLRGWNFCCIRNYSVPFRFVSKYGSSLDQI